MSCLLHRSATHLVLAHNLVQQCANHTTTTSTRLIIIATSTRLFMGLDFGLNAVVVKSIASSPPKRSSLFRSLFGLRLVIAAIIYLLIVFPLLLSPTPIDQGYTMVVKISILLFSLQYFAQAIILTTNSIFQSYLQYAKVVAATTLGNLLQLILIILTLNTTTSLLTITSIHLLGILITAAFSLLLVKPHLDSLLPHFSLVTSKHLLLAAAPFGLALVFNLFTNRLDTILLAAFRPNLEVGYYGLARRIFDGILVIPSFFMNAVYPVFLAKMVSSRHRLPAVIKQSSLLLLGSSLAMSLIALILAPLVTVIRPEFAPTIPALRLLTLFLPVFFITSLLMWAAIALDRQAILFRTYFLAFVFNLIANLLFIPRFGYLSASITTGLTEIIVLVLLLPPVLQSLREFKK